MIVCNPFITGKPPESARRDGNQNKSAMKFYLKYGILPEIASGATVADWGSTGAIFGTRPNCPSTVVLRLSRAMLKFSIADFATQSKEVTHVINEAYDVESGVTGIAFNSCSRLLDSKDSGMDEAYQEKRVIVATDKPGGPILGVIVYEFTDEESPISRISFGPLAVSNVARGRGIGYKLMEEVERIGRERGVQIVDINVVNHRSDLFPYYDKLGFKTIGEGVFPHPERTTRDTFFYIMRRPLPPKEQASV